MSSLPRRREPSPEKLDARGGGHDAPHDFVVVIPVADRPRHLADCLDSLIALCREHPYAGRISVLVADDSREPDNIARHRTLAESLGSQGLAVHHLDQAAQRALVGALPPELRRQLAGVVGDPGAERFFHKGAAITRNIAYLWLNRLQRDGRRRLFWFIDSDQEFRVNVKTAGGEAQAYAVDYFHWLDRIFRETPTRILTGKVVGDPPVSPAVMAGTCLDDAEAFLGQMADLDPARNCTFHGEAAGKVDDAAYHDMAELFGFKPKASAYRYRCPLRGRHDHSACFADFASRLNRFFDGEHPTRRSVYEASDPLASIQPARTIYTGNYVFGPEGLAYFIPFAGLRLRMAGPTLGRLIRAEQGDRFVSANLPMLHKRTVEEIGQSEFRPGIERDRHAVDLSDEFERQYFGDVMLFAMERLTASGYPGTAAGEADAASIVEAVEREMHEKYRAKHIEVAGKVARLQALFETEQHWWQEGSALEQARQAWRRFIANMQDNFGHRARAWLQVDDPARRRERSAAICAAIGQYRQVRAAWREALAAT